MWRRSPYGWLALACLATSAVWPAPAPAGAQTAEVAATVETDPVPSGGDAADDPAVWVHPEDPSLSTVIATDKEGGLIVYDLAGRRLQYVAGIRPNNVDIRHGFPLGGETIDLVVASERNDDVITFHRVDPRTRRLDAVGEPVDAGVDIYGICAYHSPVDGSFYVFATSEEAGPVVQLEITDDGSGGVSARRVRELPMGSVAEGCVADDGLGYLYVAEEDVGIWKYSAEPDGGRSRLPVDRVGARLEADVEGLTIYYGPGESGYLIASSQGSGEFVVYERSGDNRHVTGFRLVDGGRVDGVEDTDGIDVVAAPLGPGFPAGMFVAQDGDNDTGNQSFKLVPWERIAGSVAPPLEVATSWDPRAGTVSGVPAPTIPGDAGARTWQAAAALVGSAGDDATQGSAGAATLTMGNGSRTVLAFTGLEVPPGAVLRRAHVTFTSASDQAGEATVTITALHGGSAAGTASVTWAPAPWASGKSGPYQQTPDLSMVIGEILAGGWRPGERLTLAFTTEGPGRREAQAYEGGPDAAPMLRLEFSLGP